MSILSELRERLVSHLRRVGEYERREFRGYVRGKTLRDYLKQRHIMAQFRRSTQGLITHIEWTRAEIIASFEKATGVELSAIEERLQTLTRAIEALEARRLAGLESLRQEIVQLINASQQTLRQEVRQLIVEVTGWVERGRQRLRSEVQAMISDTLNRLIPTGFIENPMKFILGFITGDWIWNLVMGFLDTLAGEYYAAHSKEEG